MELLSNLSDINGVMYWNVNMTEYIIPNKAPPMRPIIIANTNIPANTTLIIHFEIINFYFISVLPPDISGLNNFSIYLFHDPYGHTIFGGPLD